MKFKPFFLKANSVEANTVSPKATTGSVTATNIVSPKANIASVIALTCGTLACGVMTSSAKASEHDLFELSLLELLSIEVVTSSGFNEDQQKAASILSVITHQEISQYGYQNLHQLLSRIPGLYPFGETAFRDNVVSIRGQHASITDRRILVLIDGRPVRDAHIGGLNNAVYRNFPLSLIDRIEVIRGPGSVLYGSNAMAGVINIITKSENADNVTIEVAEFGTRQIESVFQSTFTNGKFSIAGLNHKSDGFDYTFTDSTGFTDSTNYGSERNTLHTAIDYKALGVSFYHANIQDTVVGFNAPSWPESHYDFNRNILNISFHPKSFENGYSEIHWTWNNGSRQNDATNTNSNINVEDNYHIVDAKSVFNITDSLDLTTGLSLHWWDVKDRSNPNNNFTFKNDWQAVYGQINYDISTKISLTGGAQHYDTGNEKDTSFRAGTVYQINSAWVTKLLWAEAFRGPYGSEQSFDSAVLKGNPELTSEKLSNWDWQLSYQNKKLSAEMSLYKAELKDAIEVTYNPILNHSQYVNRRHLYFKGGEFNLRYRPTRSTELHLSWSEQLNKTDDGIKNNQKTPNTMIKTGIDWKATHEVHLSLFNIYYDKLEPVVNRNPDVAIVNPDTGAYNHLRATLTLAGELIHPDLKDTSWQIGGDNLLETQAVYLPTLRQTKENTAPYRAGRNFYVKFNWQF